MLLNDVDRMGDEKKYEDAYSVQRGRFNNDKSTHGKGKERRDYRKQFQGVCHNCKKKGHFARDCPERYKRGNKQQHGDQNKGSVHCAEKDEADLDQEALITSNCGDNVHWIVDSGATQHMTYQKNCLYDYVDFKKPCIVNLGDDRTISAYGKGSYNILADINGRTQNISLREVLYLPELGKNLLSIRAMTRLGASVEFQGDECLISRNGKLLAKGEICGKLFVLKTIGDEQVNVAKKTSQGELWHCRFGHLGYDNISKLAKGNMVKGMNNFQEDEIKSVCESCIMGKQHRTPYPKNDPHRAEKSFEIVHSDVCGPMEIPSLGKSLYFVTFIDDLSRYTQVYFIKQKNQVLEKFKEFVNYAENSGKKVNILRTDNGGEYCSKEFNSYLKEKGITHQTTVPHNPAQNGVAERMNRTLLETARSMMAHADIPTEFWAEAVSTATYIRNRSPTTAVKEVTPFECFFGYKPDVSSMKVFGCLAYAHIPKSKRKKLDAKSSKCIFVGYPEGTKGFKLYNPETKSFIKSRDVIFDEWKFYNFDNKNSNTANTFEIQTPFMQTDDDNEENDDRAVREDNIFNPEPNNPVGETYEETFMQQVKNLNLQRERRPLLDTPMKRYMLQMISLQILMNPGTLMKHGHVIRKRNGLKPLMLSIFH